MHRPEDTILLSFYCGVCTKRLTDATALLTSCGHFFCFTAEAKCTRLRPNHNAGRCEQCGRECEAGTIPNGASNYDSRVRSSVFSDLAKDLRSVADIVQFRTKHLQILGENAEAQRKRIERLTAECKSRTEELQTLRRENKELRLELSKQKKKNLVTSNFGSPTETRAYERDGSDDGITIVPLDAPATSGLRQMRSRRVATPHEGIRITRRAEPVTRTRLAEHTPHESIRTNGGAEPITRARIEQTYDRSLGARTIRKRRGSQPMGSTLRATHGASRKDDGAVPLKRRWGDRTGTDGVPGWSKAGRKENVSRFGNPAGEPRGAVQDSYKPWKQVTGDWQRKVSSVPRPSATPDKFRRRTKRSVLDPNPLGKQY